jgi:hypothetical protein
MFCIKCGFNIYDGARFCPKCGKEINANTTVPIQQKNNLKTASPAKPKKRFGFGIIIAVAAAVIILGIIIYNDKNKNSSYEYYSKENPLEDTAWEYSSGFNLFGLGVKRNITIEFTAVKYNLTNANKLGYGNLGIDFPSAEIGSYTIAADNTIILLPDSGNSVNLASLSELKDDYGGNLSTFWDKLVSFISDEDIDNKPAVTSPEQEKPSEVRKYTGLFTKRSLTIGDKTFKRK